MAILRVPAQYKTIQAAINSAKPFDTVEVSPGTYKENLVIQKDNITLIVPDSQVILDGSSLGGTGISLYGNNNMIFGIIIRNFFVGVGLIGNENRLTYVRAFNNSYGISLNGNRNSIKNCYLNLNTVIAMYITGSYNQVSACQLTSNLRGIGGRIGETGRGPIGTVIYKCRFVKNTNFHISFGADGSDKNVIADNFFSGGEQGVVSLYGRIALIANTMSDVETISVELKDDRHLILDNFITGTETGMSLNTSHSLVAGNVLERGTNGIVVIGQRNTITRNIAAFQNDVGLTVSGCNNTLCKNVLKKNGIPLILSGANSGPPCEGRYCPLPKILNENNLQRYLEIFDWPAHRFFQ